LPYFLLFYDLVDDYVARRTEFRQEHLRLVREASARGEILLAGALAEPADRAVLAFRCAGRETPEAFAKQDPYVVNGLVKKWEVRLWNNVVENA
jgi:uncharacterized protein YciI